MILLKYAGLPSFILISKSISFPSALTSTGVTDENNICESIPFEDHDVPMNALVTPKRFIPINL